VSWITNVFFVTVAFAIGCVVVVAV